MPIVIARAFALAAPWLAATRFLARGCTGCLTCSGLALRGVVAGLCLALGRFGAFVPRALRIVFLGSKLGLAAMLMGGGCCVALAAVFNPYLKADLDYAHERSSTAEIFDREGRWLGIVPPASFGDWSDGSVLPEDHAAVPVLEIPPAWRACAVVLEDGAFDGISGALGVNPVQVLKSGWQTITFQRRRGASTLYMQVVRSLYGRLPERGEALGQMLLRKSAELFGANALARMLREHDGDAAARFVGMHLPLVIGTTGSGFGEPLYGIELAARLLFTAPAGSLSPEQQAILAAAIKDPVVLAPPGDRKGANVAEARWMRVKARADYCLSKAFPELATEMSAARARLRDMDLPRPAVDPKLARLLPRDPLQAWRVAVNPARRTLFFARHELAAATAEVEQAVGRDWRGRVVAIRLTTSASQGRPFADAVENVLRRLQSTLEGLDLALMADVRGPDMADVVVACADPQGQVRRVYSNRDGLFWSRLSPLGSTAKLLAAVALGASSSPQAHYCAAPMGGRGSLEVAPPEFCRRREAWLTAREAFASSNSRAVHWALLRLDPKDLEALAADFSLPVTGAAPLPVALSVGTFELTPAGLQRIAAAIGFGLAGTTREGGGLSIVGEITVIDESGRKATTAARHQPILSGRIRARFTPRVRAFVAAVLRATSDPDGTLHALGTVRRDLSGELYAKTGTVSTAGSTLDLHIAGTFMSDRRPWSFVVSVGARSKAHPLGHRLVAGSFAPLAELAICRDADRETPFVAAQ